MSHLPPSVDLHVLRHPVDFARESRSVPSGGSVAAILESQGFGYLLKPGVHAVISLEHGTSHRLVRAADAAYVVPPPGSLLGVRVVARGGGGGGGKSPLSMALSIAVIAAAAWAAPAASFWASQTALGNGIGWSSALTIGSLAKAAVGGGIMMLGSMAVNALAPPQSPKVSAGGSPDMSTSNRSYSMTGVRNRLMKYEPYAHMVGGSVRIYPPLLAEPYTEIVGEKRYLNYRFGLIGPVAFDEFKLGETPLDEFEHTIEHVEGFEGDGVPGLFAGGNDIHEEGLSIALTEAAGTIERRTQGATRRISFDLGMPRLFTIDAAGGRKENTVAFRVKYRVVGSETWLVPPIDGIGADGTLSVSGLYESERRFTYEFEVPEAGQYDIQWQRITGDDDDDGKLQYQTFIPTLRSVAYNAGLNLDMLPPMAVIDLRIEDDGTGGSLDDFNCMAHAYLPVWTGAAFEYQRSDNPAWAYVNTLYGRQRSEFYRITDPARYDLDGLTAWAALCEEQGWTVNGIRDYRATIGTLLHDIASVGRASRAKVDNKFGVSVDWHKAGSVQLITPRNSWGFKWQKAFPDHPHALRVRYVDASAGYIEAERIVYADGYDKTTATLFEDLDLRFVTDADLAWKIARFHLADAKLRPELYTFNQGIENLRYRRGARVTLVSRIIRSALGSARVRRRATHFDDDGNQVAYEPVVYDDDGYALSADIDSRWTMLSAKSYACKIRLMDGTLVEAFLVSPGVDSKVSTIVFADPIAPTASPRGGELISFGYAEQPVGIDAIVTKIEHGRDATAKITARPYAPGVFSSDQGPVPAFDPQIHRPIDAVIGRPLAPSITTVVSDETVMVRRVDGSLSVRAAVSVSMSSDSVPLSGWQLQYKPSINEVWEDGGVHSLDVRTAFVADLHESMLYDFRVRAVAAGGKTSVWTTAYHHTVEGDTNLPPAVGPVSVEGGRILWDYPDKPVTHAGYRVRYAPGVRPYAGAGVPAHDGLLADASMDISRFSGGTMTFMVWAVDASGNESESFRHVITNLGDPAVENIIEKISFAPVFSGAISGGQVEDGAIAAQSVSGFWPADAEPFWPDADEPFWPEDRYSALVYQTAVILPPELGGERLLVQVGAVGNIGIFYRKMPSVPFWPADSEPFWPADSDPFWWSAEDTPAWKPWPGSVAVESTEYQFRFEIPTGATRGAISDVDIIVDVPDIVEKLLDVSIEPGGTRLPTAVAWRSVEYVNVPALDESATAERIVLVDRSVDGPMVKAVDGSGTSVAAVCNFQIGGY